ncbi:MAG: TIGR03943 family protein [Pseudomonadota bacterium]
MKQWLTPIVFGIWTCTLLHLLASQRYTVFLRPELGLLLGLAYFIAMGFMVATLMGTHRTVPDFSAVLRALILLLPVLYLMIMGDNRLGGSAFKNRFVGPAVLTMERNDMDRKDELDPRPWKKEKASPASPESDAIGSAAQRALREPTILEIFKNPKRYDGQRVIVSGMILRDEKLGPHFGGRDTAVYRFLMTCCAADALPLAIALDSKFAQPFEKDQWVRVAGIFRLVKIHDKPVPFMEDPVITPAEAPAFPYLF